MSKKDSFPQAYKRDFFKYSTFAILAVLVFLRFLSALLQVRIIPDIIAISITILCLLYMWLAESRDIDRLKQMNIDLFQAQQELEESHVDTILSLVLSQEAKDSYTYGHSERVRQYAVAIAKEMDLEKEDVDIIARAAKLHDIGKIGIKDTVLFSHQGLTEDQKEIIQSHPTKGVVILEPLRFLDEEKRIVHHHHERYDGTGYPDRLKGEQIPTGARIIAVADAFDAMRTQRPYNAPLSKQGIIDELKNNAGTQFDPQVVDAFLKNIDHFYV